MGDMRCTERKHVKERGNNRCDCGALMFALTASKNALVVTVLDPVQMDALARMESSP